jgi:hypothetical protein
VNNEFRQVDIEKIIPLFKKTPVFLEPLIVQMQKLQNWLITPRAGPLSLSCCAASISKSWSACGHQEIKSTELKMNKCMYNYVYNFTSVLFCTTCVIKLYTDNISKIYLKIQSKTWAKVLTDVSAFLQNELTSVMSVSLNK